jgi:hypothetical protein
MMKHGVTSLTTGRV